MKGHILLLLLAVERSQQVNLKWGVKDVQGDGTDTMFTHKDVQRDEELANSMDSLKEAEQMLNKKLGGVKKDDLPSKKEKITQDEKQL